MNLYRCTHNNNNKYASVHWKVTPHRKKNAYTAHLLQLRAREQEIETDIEREGERAKKKIYIIVIIINSNAP